MFTLVVFTLVVGATIDRLVRQRLQRRQERSAAASTCARDVSPRARSPTCHQALRHAPGPRAQPTSASSSSQSFLPVKAHQVGDAAKRGGRTSSTASTARSSRNTTYGLAARARGYGSAPAVWRALRTHPGLAVVDPLVVPRRRELQLRRGRGVPAAAASTSRTRPSPRSASTCATRRPAGAHADRDRRPLRHAPQRDGRALDLAAHARAGVRRPRRRRPTYLFALRPGVDPSRDRRATLESAFLANGMQADSLSKLLARRGRREPHLRPPDRWASWDSA